MNDIGLPLPWGIVPTERVRRVVLVPNPAAGAEWSVQVPGGTLWDVRAVRARLVTSAVVASRRVALQVTDGSAILLDEAPIAPQAATTTVDYSWIEGYNAVAGGSPAVVASSPLWDAPLYGGYVVRTVTALLDGGDQWSAIVLTVEEYEVRGLERALERYEAALLGVGMGG